MPPAYLYAGLTVLFWSTIATAFKLSLGGLAVPQLVFAASLVSTLVLWLGVLARGKLHAIRSAPASDWAKSLGLGLLNPLGYYLVVLTAYARLPAQEAQALNFTWPVVLAVLAAPVLGQPLARRTLAGLLVSFAGVVLVATRGDPLSLRVSDPLGAGLAAGSSLIWALYWLLNMRDRRAEEVKLAMAFTGALPLLGLLAWRTWTPVTGWQPWAGAAYVGLFEMGVTFLCWLRALTLARSAAQVTRLVYLVPFLSLVWIRLVLGEPIRWSTPLGLLLILVGIGLAGQPGGDR